MNIGWYIHTFYLDINGDTIESPYVYGPYFPKRKAWYVDLSLGRQYFVYRVIKFHLKKPIENSPKIP